MSVKPGSPRWPDEFQSCIGRRSCHPVSLQCFGEGKPLVGCEGLRTACGIDVGCSKGFGHTSGFSKGSPEHLTFFSKGNGGQFEEEGECFFVGEWSGETLNVDDGRLHFRWWEECIGRDCADNMRSAVEFYEEGEEASFRFSHDLFCHFLLDEEGEGGWWTNAFPEHCPKEVGGDLVGNVRDDFVGSFWVGEAEGVGLNDGGGHRSNEFFEEGNQAAVAFDGSDMRSVFQYFPCEDADASTDFDHMIAELNVCGFYHASEYMVIDEEMLPHFFGEVCMVLLEECADFLCEGHIREW